MATTPTSSSAQTLHYGGSISSKTGRLGSKPAPGAMFKKLKRLELIVRLENAGLTEAAAAAMLTISVPRLRFIKKSPDYLAARMKITHGIIVDFDKDLDLVKSQRKEILAGMLPPALLAIANELQMPAITLAERKHKVAIAQDLLDREGSYAKISRAEVKPVEHFDFESADKASASVIAAVKGIAAPSASAKELASKIVEANVEFSKSHTLSEVDQQAALTELEKVQDSLREDLKAQLAEIQPEVDSIQ